MGRAVRLQCVHEVVPRRLFETKEKKSKDGYRNDNNYDCGQLIELSRALWTVGVPDFK